MALKHMYPDWLQGDLFFGADYFRAYNPLFFSMQARVARLAETDPAGALRVLVWPVGVLFLIGHYVFFRGLTGSRLAGALGAVAATTVRHALGGEYWGFGGVRDVLPRTVASALTPVLLLLFLRLRDHRFFVVYFLLIGAVANLHPVSGLHLAMICGVAHLWLGGFGRKAWLEVLGGAALFTVAVLPFVLRYLPAQENVTDPALLPRVREALHARYDYLLYPLDARALISVAFHAFLPAALFGWTMRAYRTTPDVRPLTVLLVASLGVGLVGAAMIQAVGTFLDRPYLDVHQLRATRFMYLSLLSGFAFAFLWLRQRNTRRAWAALVILAVVSLVSPDWALHSLLAGPRDVVKRTLGLPVEAPAALEDGEARRSARAEREMWEFVAQTTGRNELFFTDSFAFRYETLRPITGSFKDGGIIIAGTAPFYRWYGYMREVQGCRRERGRACWLSLARRYGASNAITDPELDLVTDEAGWAQTWSADGWAVWTRR
jgi:hypothetical protein